MYTYPEDDDDRKELARLGAETWMVELLKLNPAYNSWGPGQDCMDGEEERGRTSALAYPDWPSFDVVLDNLNECVHFHFEIARSGATCAACDGSGYNPETKRINDDYYDFAETGRRWIDKITPDEAQALRDEHRIGGAWNAKRAEWLPDGRTPEELAADCNASGGICHDGINAYILVKARATRLGVYGLCPRCEGHGSVFTEDKARLALVLWILHPRKGASRGATVRNIRQNDLPSVFAWLTEAARRNAERFEKVVVAAAKGGKEP